MVMTITLEAIYEDIRLLRAELHRLLCILEDKGELTDEACQKLQKAREETHNILATKRLRPSTVYDELWVD